MLCRRDERLPLHSPGLIRIEVTNSAITYQVGSQLILTRTSPIVKRVHEVLRMGAQFPFQQWLRTWLTDHRGRLKLAVAVVVGAGATTMLAQGSRRSQHYFSAGSIAGNLKSCCSLPSQPRHSRHFCCRISGGFDTIPTRDCTKRLPWCWDRSSALKASDGIEHEGRRHALPCHPTTLVCP